MIKAGTNLSISIAAPTLGYSLTGNSGIAATSVGLIAGTRGKKDSKIIRNESLSGAIFGTFAHYTLLPLRYLNNIGKIAYIALWRFPANAFYLVFDYLIKNKSIKSLYTKFKESYWSGIKKAFKTVFSLNVASALFLPIQYILPAIAFSGYIFKRFVSGDKGEKEIDKTPYLVATSNVLRKLAKNIFYGTANNLYTIGSNTKDYLQSASKATKAEFAPTSS